MLPQLNPSTRCDPTPTSRHARGGVNDSLNGSDAGTVSRVSSSSRKFDGAMEIYHQSMAIRRRRMSTSNSTMRSSDSTAGGDSAESSAVQSSTSLRGPQLRPSACLTRVDASISPRSQQRLGCRLPSLLSPQLPPAHSTPPTVHRPQSNCSHTSSPTATTPPSAVVRRSTRRPLSQHHGSSSLSLTTTSRENIATSHPPLNIPPYMTSSTEDVRLPPNCFSADLSAASLNGEGTLKHAEEGTLGSMHSLVYSPSGNEQRAVTKHTSVFQNRDSSLNSSRYDGHSTCRAQAPHRESSSGSKDDASQCTPAKTYDVIGSNSMFIVSREDALPQRRLSLYMPMPSDMPALPQQQPHNPSTPPLKLKAPPTRPVSTTTPRRHLLTCGSSAGSPSLALFEPEPHSSTAVCPAVATLQTTDQLSTKTPTVPVSSSNSLDLPSLLTTTTTSTKTLPAPSTSNTATALTKCKMDPTGCSRTQPSLSSAVKMSESRHGSRDARKTSRRDLSMKVTPPLPLSPSTTTEALTANAASPNSMTAPNGRTNTPIVEAAAAAASPISPIDLVPVPGTPNPGLVSMTDKKTAQFYSTASLARTYDGSQFLNDYILLSEIGSGATGRVVLAFSTSMLCSVAIKIISKPQKRKYRLQRPPCSSDSSIAPLSASDRRNTNDGGKMSDTGAAQRNSSIPVPPNGRYNDLVSKGAASDAADRTASTSAPTARRKSVSSPTRLTTAERMTRNLQREVDVMKDLNHPNIVRLYEVINDPKANSLFLILQYVDSGAIAQLNSSGCIAAPFSPEALLPIATQVIDGLVYLHEHRIVHRDIKPENILINRDGQAFLADFGVAELMNAESGLPTATTLAYQGTPLFMAPEIYMLDDDKEEIDLLHMDVKDASASEKKTSAAAHPDKQNGPNDSATGINGSKPTTQSSPRTIDPYALDVWALGVTLYTLLVGRVPFNSVLQIRQSLYNGVKVPSGVPEDWCRVLRCTMEPNVNKRVSSAQLKRMLHAMLNAANKKEVNINNNCTGEQKNSTAQGGDVHGHHSHGLFRQPMPASARMPHCASDDEDVILGSDTPTEVVPLPANGGRLVDDLESSGYNFSINSSVLDVLRPVKR